MEKRLMKRGSFVINNVTSEDLKSVIQERPAIPSARRKLNRRSAPGISGDYLFDEEAFENVSFSLSFFAKGNTEEEVNNLRDSISATFTTGGYVDMVLYSDDTYIYEVVVENEPEYSPNGRMPLLLPYTVGFSAKPFKRFDSTDMYEGTKNLTIANPTPYVSKPEITLYGTGDMQLHVNGVAYPFKEIDDHVNVDSKTENAYKQNGNQVVNRNHRMYALDFPVLEPGSNTLSVSGGATRFRVTPRWRMKL